MNRWIEIENRLINLDKCSAITFHIPSQVKFWINDEVLDFFEMEEKEIEELKEKIKSKLNLIEWE